MQNDLISRSELLKALETWGGDVEVLAQYIKDMPTAYSVEKVEAEVLEITERIFNYCEEIDLNIPEEERSGYNMLTDIRRLRECVRNGGKE